MRNLELESLHVFKAVVDCGGISKAAAFLNRVQSNVTTRVQQLEQRLGVTLFQRQGGRLVLSAEGRVLLSYTERLLRLAAEAESALQAGKPCGVLRIGTMESTAATRLPPLLAGFHHHYPDVQVELTTGTSGALLRKLHSFEIDAAFVADPFVRDDLEVQEAFTEELVLISAKGDAAIKNAADLRRRTVIAFSAGCSYRRILEDWLMTADIAPERVLELASYHAIVACVAAGTGIAIMPRSVLQTLKAESDLASFTLPAKVAKAKTYLVARAGQSSTALEALRKELLQIKKSMR